MKIKHLLQELEEFEPRLFMGSDEAEVSSVVEDYQSVYDPEGIYVQSAFPDSKGSRCAPTILTCNEFLGCFQPMVMNVIVVDIAHIDAASEKLDRLL